MFHTDGRRLARVAYDRGKGMITALEDDTEVMAVAGNNRPRR